MVFVGSICFRFNQQKKMMVVMVRKWTQKGFVVN